MLGTEAVEKKHHHQLVQTEYETMQIPRRYARAPASGFCPSIDCPPGVSAPPAAPSGPRTQARTSSNGRSVRRSSPGAKKWPSTQLDLNAART